jgi:hypothetical protein
MQGLITALRSLKKMPKGRKKKKYFLLFYTAVCFSMGYFSSFVHGFMFKKNDCILTAWA